MNIFILYGGTSAEHKVSISSGLSVAEAIGDLYNVEMVMHSGQIFNNPQDSYTRELLELMPKIVSID